MSLFRLIEWVSHTIPNASAVLNASFFDEREQLVVGCEDGQIVVLDPGFKDDNNHVLVTAQTKYPVLQMACGNFLSQMTDVLAVLSPKKLIFYKVSYANETEASLDEIFSHSFQTSAWNMCVISPQTKQDEEEDENTPAPHIMVQSIDCKLSLYQGDQCVFSLVPLRALHPGPIGFCKTTQTLIVANNGFLASIKFTLMSSGSQKRINYDWSFNLGDTAIQMDITEGSKPTILILCRRHVSALSSDGSVIWQIRLEAVGMSMCLYRSLLINNTAFNRLIIATADDTLLIYQDNQLVWNCNAQMSPVQLLVCSYNKHYENTITLLSSNGRIVVGYLGTEPSLYKVPVDKFIVNYEERRAEFKELEKKIRESDASGNSGGNGKDGIQMMLTIGENGKRTIEPNAANNVPYCSVNVELSQLQNISKIQVNVHSQMASPSKQYVLSVSESKATASIQIPFYVGSKGHPTNNKVTIAVHDYFTQSSAVGSIELPFKTLFDESQVDRNAKFKVTIDTSEPVLPLDKLFSEFDSENPQAIGFSLHGSEKTVSVFAANKSNRYRIQSEHMFLLQIVSKELVRRVCDAAPQGIQMGGNVPFEYIRETLDTIQELEMKKKEDSKKMECRTKEVRAIETLSLNSCKTGNMTNLPSLDALFDKSYRELLDTMDNYNKLAIKLEDEKTTLNSLFQLASDLSKLSKVETTLTGEFWTNTSQSLQERLRWAVRSDRGNEMSMIEKLCEHTQKELPKVLEEVEKEEKPKEEAETSGQN